MLETVETVHLRVTFHKGGGNGSRVANGLPQTTGEHHRHPSGLVERFAPAGKFISTVWNKVDRWSGTLGFNVEQKKNPL